MGDIGLSNLYAQYDDYQTNAFDFGIRRYSQSRPKLRAYGEALIGFAFVDKIGVTLVAPGANLVSQAADFYDSSTAFTFAVNMGAVVQTTDTIGFFGQLGFRRTGGLAEVDNLIGTGLDDINDKSSRWTLPFIFGVRYQF